MIVYHHPGLGTLRLVDMTDARVVHRNLRRRSGFTMIRRQLRRLCNRLFGRLRAVCDQNRMRARNVFDMKLVIRIRRLPQR